MPHPRERHTHADMAGMGHGPAAELLDRSGHFPARFNAATGDNDISTGLGKTQCHSSAQPSAAARDQYDLSRHADNVLLQHSSCSQSPMIHPCQSMKATRRIRHPWPAAAPSRVIRQSLTRCPTRNAVINATKRDNAPPTPAMARRGFSCAGWDLPTRRRRQRLHRCQPCRSPWATRSRRHSQSTPGPW